MTHADAKKNKSETLFVRFCTDLGIPFTPISRTNEKTPDYDITLSGHKVVTEIKQCDPNKDDNLLWAKARSRGIGSAFEKSGRRVRLEIQSCKKQLKARSKEKFPTMLVLYDNGTFFDIDATDIKTAMYGDEKGVITSTGGAVTNVSEIHPGGGRKFTADCSTSISGIALMYLQWRQNTAIPLSQSLCRNPNRPRVVSC